MGSIPVGGTMAVALIILYLFIACVSIAFFAKYSWWNVVLALLWPVTLLFLGLFGLFKAMLPRKNLEHFINC